MLDNQAQGSYVEEPLVINFACSEYVLLSFCH